jgi:hypothetical protein
VSRTAVGTSTVAMMTSSHPYPATSSHEYQRAAEASRGVQADSSATRAGRRRNRQRRFRSICRAVVCKSLQPSTVVAR